MASPPSEARTARWLAAALFVLTLLLFAPGIGHDFVNYDDPDYVTSNAHVRAGLTGDTVKWAFTSGEASNWHPLTWLSHALDVSLFGLNPHGHHLTSILLHALNAVLAFFVFRRLTGALWAGAFFAALFAWHPLRVESVAWVAERKDVLCAFFGLAILWLYPGYVEKRRAGRTAAWGVYAGLLGLFALGLMAKPMLVTLPCVLVLLDLWPLGRTRWLAASAPVAKPEPLWQLVAEKLPFFVLVVISAKVTYWAQSGGGSVSSALEPGARVANAVVSVVRYLGKFFVPIDLAVLYPHPGHWSGGIIAVALLLVSVLTGLALWQWRRRPWLAVGWLWFLGMLVPVSGLVQVGLQSMADRYTYLPILGVQLAVIWSWRDRWTGATSRFAGAFAAVLVLSICAIATLRQLRTWEDSGALFTQAIAATSNNFVAHDNRGLFHYKAGRVDEALADYRASLAINPAYLNANNNLGHALSELGRPAEAVPYYRIALQAQPSHLEVRNNLANALSDLGELKEAMEHYDFVLARKPDHANALNGSAVVLAMQGQPDQAKARLEQSLRIAPDAAATHNNLGNVCSMLGQTDSALAHYRRALELKPDDAHTLFTVGAILNQQGKFTESVDFLRRSVALRPKFPDALAHFGLALAQTGRRDEAVNALRAALQLQPGHAQAAQWLKAVEGK